jgi:hypothetical protein
MDTHWLPLSLRWIRPLPCNGRRSGRACSKAYESGMGNPRRTPSDGAAGIGMDNEGHVDEAGAGGDIGEVRKPEPIRRRRMELAVELVERARNESYQLHLPPSLEDPIDREDPGKDPHDLRLAGFIALGIGVTAGRSHVAGPHVHDRCRGDRQDFSDRLDPIVPAMLIDKGDHRFNWRSSSAWAKYAEALLRISLACRGSRLSRSQALVFSAARWARQHACHHQPRSSSPSRSGCGPSRRASGDAKPRQPSVTDTPCPAPAPSALHGSVPRDNLCVVWLVRLYPTWE